jgi:hypothetical protein
MEGLHEKEEKLMRRTIALLTTSRGTPTQERKKEMASIRTILIRTMLTIVGILAMMLMVLLTAPDSALAKDNAEDVNSVRATCEKLKKSIGELEGKKEDGTITDHERGELNSQKELWDYLACDIVLAVKDNNPQPTGKPTGGRPGSAPTHAGNAGVAPKDDDCTWKNLWCTLAPVFEAVQTALSPDPGPADVDALANNNDTSPPQSDMEPADVDALAKDNGTPPPKSDMDRLKEEGYTCGRAGVDSHICKKGDKSYVCGNDGRCAPFNITNPKPTWELPESPTNAGVARAQSQSLEPSSGQYSSGEGTEISVDPGVERSEGSTTEAER